MGRKRKEIKQLEEIGEEVQELANEACELKGYKAPNLDAKGRFLQNNEVERDYMDSLSEIPDDESLFQAKDDVRKIFLNSSKEAANVLVRTLRSTKTPAKERREIASMIITSLFGKTPLDNIKDSVVRVVLPDELKKYSK